MLYLFPFAVVYYLSPSVLCVACVAGYLGVHNAFEFGHGTWGICCLCLADRHLQDTAVTSLRFSPFSGSGHATLHL